MKIGRFHFDLKPTAAIRILAPLRNFEHVIFTTLIKSELLKHIFNKLNVDFVTPISFNRTIVLLAK